MAEDLLHGFTIRSNPIAAETEAQCALALAAVLMMLAMLSRKHTRVLLALITIRKVLKERL